MPRSSPRKPSIHAGCQRADDFWKFFDRPLLKQTFVARAAAGEFRATALVYDVRVQTPTQGVNTDAIAVALDHRDNYSVIVFLPYRLDGEKLTLGDMFAQRGTGEVFEPR